MEHTMYSVQTLHYKAAQTWHVLLVNGSWTEATQAFNKMSNMDKDLGDIYIPTG